MIIYKVYFGQCSFFTEIVFKALKIEVKIKEEKSIGVSRKSNRADKFEHKWSVLFFLTIITNHLNLSSKKAVRISNLEKIF